ncbi:MAG: 3-oxoacyl-ACP synthase [Treponema sp.]|nr:3-oxoacyl-ACP synthase [Treponema sp.]
MDIFFSKPGVFCAAGSNPEELWISVTEGNQSGIRRVKTELSGEDFFAARIADEKLKPSSSRYDMRIMRIEEETLVQIEADIEKAKIKYGSERVAVCVGSCDNGTEFSVAGHKVFFKEGKFAENYNLEIQGADYVSTFISEKYGINGPACTFSTACSSSAGAIIKGAELIKSGMADAVIAGGIDIASDTVLIGFNSLEAVSSEITNPFSKNRHGITLGEAGAFFVLSREPLDDSIPCIKLKGFGESSDAYHMTSPDPTGDGAERAMRKALLTAGLEPKDIDYINLHGTGTKFNDSMEAKAVDRIFGDYKVPVSTTKCETGHTLGAAGALEAVVCWFTLFENLSKSNKNAKLPVQVWDGEQDSEMPVLNIVGKNTKVEKSEIRNCMSNSFAFGGANACLIIGL